jgi:hypothetical protein
VAVRSRPFALVQSLTGGAWRDIYQVPAGRTAIIRRWSLVNRSSNPVMAQLGVRSGSTTATIHRSDPLPAAGNAGEPDSNLVLGPGDVLVMWVGMDSATYTVHAYFGGSLLLGAPE